MRTVAQEAIFYLFGWVMFGGGDAWDGDIAQDRLLLVVRALVRRVIILAFYAVTGLGGYNAT